MVVSTGKCVAATCQLYFCCLGRRSGCALRNAHRRRLFHILRHLLSRLHSPRKYRSDRSKQPRLLFFREPQALSPTRTGKSGKHLCQAKRIRCGMNAHNHEILSTEDFPSYIQANHIFYG